MKRVLPLALGTLLLTAPLLEDGWAKRPKSFVKVFVDGR